MTPVEASTMFTKFVDAVKDLPAWLFTAFALGTGVLMSVPAINATLPETYRPWLVICTVLFGVLAICKWVQVIVGFWWSARATAKAKKTFHVTPILQSCYWAVSKRADGSMVTQIVADFSVKNQSTALIGLMSARIIRPAIKGRVLTNMITVRAQNSRMHGTAHISDHRIPAAIALPARAIVMIEGKPKEAEERDLDVLLGITDEDGHEERVRVLCRGTPKPSPAGPHRGTRESLQSIKDANEKDVAAVLQSELSRYEKNGRQVGGLGSIHLSYRGALMNQIGGDSWTPNSPINQEIIGDPQDAVLRSDNLDALLALSERPNTAEDRDRFANFLLSRIDQDRGYASVTYMIVCTLWKLGFLSEALNAALLRLQENDLKNFGLSNTLMMFNGLLRYRHPDFTSEALDIIDRFLQVTQEHPFRIPEKVAAIRVHRLVRPA